MPIVKKILVDSKLLDIEPSIVVNADNPSDFNDESFANKEKPASANSLRVLKSYIDSAIIPTEALTFDTTPTLNSNKPVTSDGIKRYVDAAIEAYFNSKFIVLTQEEYDELYEQGLIQADKYYMIVESEYTPDYDN